LFQEFAIMAFSVRSLSVLAYANGFTLWHYKTGADTLEHVSERSFFAAASDMIAAGDIMMVSASDGARLLCVAPLVGAEVETLRLA
jgi:hypothetical protein